MKNSDLFAHEEDYASLPWDKADEHLSRALQFETTSYLDTSRIRYDQFDALHSFLKESYPHVLAAGTWEEIGHSLLITLPGQNPDLRPALFMAHQDVVPLVKGTEHDWKHGPFSGDIADGYIWGRGAMDIKEMLIGILESAEYLLASGRQLNRTLILAFGEDEETCSSGAHAILDVLLARRLELEYVLDEGSGDVSDAADWGAPSSLICTIGVYEKGYADLQLTAHSKGGHSSNPFHGTSLGAIAQAIAAMLAHPPAPHLPPSVLEALRVLGSRITEEPMAGWVRDVEHHEADILGWFLSHESLYHMVQTTLAPTQIDGGSSAGNVMPQEMHAVVNMRLTPYDTPESLLEHFRQFIDREIDLCYIQKISASRPSDLSMPGYTWLRQTLEHYFERLIFIPVQNRGATDARVYEPVCRCVLRFGPFLEEEDVSREGIHSTNERISIRAYHQGIRVMTRLMEHTCFNP